MCLTLAHFHSEYLNRQCVVNTAYLLQNSNLQKLGWLEWTESLEWSLQTSIYICHCWKKSVYTYSNTACHSSTVNLQITHIVWIIIKFGVWEIKGRLGKQQVWIISSRLYYRSGTSASNFFIILSALSEYPPYEKAQLRVWTSHQTAYAKQKSVIQIVI